jgi:hypothetical protein
MKGCLDKKLLKKYGLAKQCIHKYDALFFNKLILLICAPERSGITDYTINGYYLKVMDWMAWYTVEGKYNLLYGHSFQNPVIQEFILFDGVPVRDGVKGISHGAIYVDISPSSHPDRALSALNYGLTSNCNLSQSRHVYTRI